MTSPTKLKAPDTEPLLSGSSSSSSYNGEIEVQSIKPSRHIEDVVLPETHVLGRNLSWTSAYILVISRVIGSGIFATPGSIVKTTGSVGLALLLWIFGAFISWCGMIISLEYGCMLPRSGGDKVYLEFTYQHPRFLASTLVAVHAIVLGFTASNCIIFGEYVLFALGYEVTEFSQKGLALGLLTAITLVHGCFLKTGIRIQNFLGWIKVGLILFMALTGVYVVLFNVKPRGGELPKSQLSWDGLWKDSNWGWGTLSTAIFKVSYSYAGLQNLNNVLNEVKDPVKTLKTVAPAALFTACGLYLLVNFAYFVVVPLEEVKESGELIAALFFERVFGENFGRTVLPLAIAVSAAGNVMVVTFTLARLNQEIARQGFLPLGSWTDFFSSSKPFGAPMGGLIVHYIPSFLVIAIPPRGDVYNFILDVEGYPGQFLALATALGLIWLRTKRSDLERPFKAWIPAVWLRIALCVALIAAPFFPPKDGRGKDVGFFYATYAIVGIGIILFAVLYWYVMFVALPRWYKYRIEEEVEILSDGTSVTKLVKVKDE
ncbi:probable low-affinity methionine permease [Phialocephala subalpina]|uniref:Probable low-affinity methionine permease n=1 Tax=Phialocephala subalpina TaxID=576137 RepID=A0A1L7X3G6_9HELO|nr:probable low-affinity methionine permease [Phialocephala subalpina]